MRLILVLQNGSNPLGIPIGANPRKMENWKPVIDKMRCRLSNWKRRHLSLGGRIVLIKSVLTNLPIYYLSFMKAPTKVRKAIKRIKRNFLWAGSLERNNSLCKMECGLQTKKVWRAWHQGYPSVQLFSSGKVVSEDYQQ